MLIRLITILMGEILYGKDRVKSHCNACFSHVYHSSCYVYTCTQIITLIGNKVCI